MHNFGVYAGTNTFNFTHKKPIVLIGGMNGRGKTTFLEAIFLSLYGANSIAYKESKYKSYNQYLRSYVNKNSFSQQSYVEIEFENYGTERDVFLVRREWDALTKRTREEITVLQNGMYSDFLTNNWGMFVESILPSALSSFYFFDGEKIAELAVDDTNDQMKESIRAMLGITILDVLKNDLIRNIKAISRNDDSRNSSNKVEELRSEKEIAIVNLSLIDKKINASEEKVNELQNELEALRKQHEAEGGIVIEQKQELIKNRSEKQAELSQIEEALLNIAASELPFLLIEKLLVRIKLQAEDEHNDAVMKQALSQLKLLLEDYQIEFPEYTNANNHFLDYANRRNEEDAVEDVFSLSDHALFQINDLMEKRLIETKNQTIKLMNQKKSVSAELDKIESYLSLDINENELASIFGKIKEKEDLLIREKVNLSSLHQERSGVNALVIQKNIDFNKCVEEYLQNVEMFDDVDRKLKYSNMAIQLLDRYTVELQKRKTGILGRTITECYKQLSNKKNLINTIVMDSESLDLIYYDTDHRVVDKNSLSAGEKQLMVISIIWALALCSKKKLPVIIDTPLSRLDSLHRKSIITTYYPNASEQTIILSTDSEIDREYYMMMKDNVGDEFTLIYDEESKSTMIREGYFVNDN